MLKSRPYMDAAPIPCPTGRSGHTGRFRFKRYGYSLYACETCHHLWVYPIPTESELAAYYNEGYFQGDPAKRGYKNYEHDKQSVLPLFEGYLATLERHTTDRRLLDVGSATGIFLQLAMRRGWQATGLEISEYAAQEALKKGLPVTIGQIEDTAETYRGIPVITMWDVVEHFRDPFFVFRRLGQVMEPGGLVMFSAPQADSFFARCLGRYWTLIAPPQHLNYFSRSSIDAMLTDAGFELVEMSWQGKIFDLSYLVHFVLGWIGLSWPWLERQLQRPSIRRIKFKINPRDVTIVLARKKEGGTLAADPNM